SIEVNYSAFTAEWQITGKSVPSYSDVNCYVTYGTGRANAYRILEDTLNLKDVRIYDYSEDAEGKKTRVLNKQETTLAQQKQQMIKDAFSDWVWKDPDRREALTLKYNELFNSTRPREYNGEHINFTGMNPDIKLREHQRNAIAHVLYGGNTLLAHEVGAGKTFEMTAAAMESKRLGLCHKSMFVVPNHLTLQWASEFLRLYPSAKLLVAGRKDFEKKNRRKFCARIATGDYDAVIIGHSQFERIPISKERQERMLGEQIDEIERGIAELKHNRGDNFTIKQMEKTRKSLKVRLEKLNNEDKKDDVINFEELGVDRLFVDESQAFKNLFLYTKMRNVAGLSANEAQKSSDMFMKCRYMDEITGGRGVVFATGTPVSNSMTELYTLMRYLQYGTLQKMGLTHFDCWASTFGETTTAIELAPEGTGYRARTRFAKFFNLPELMNMFKEVADIKTADTLNLPVPEAEFINVLAKPTEIQQEMVQSLSERAAIVHNNAVDPSEDNMLKITSDGRKIGLDQRLMNPDLPDDPGSKVNICIENVMKIWQEGKEKKNTQLIFCDMSTPKNDGTFNVYDDVKQKLAMQGVPEAEIAFIHDAASEAQKKELFSKVRTGKVRILMGSTQKMGAGTNVQDRLIAVHHLDVGWRPSDMTQRNGRIIRQGNRNRKVQVFNYVTEGTFDAYLWQTLENKQRFISQIMTSKSPVRSCEDVDEQALSYAEVKALCAGNPLIKEKMDLDIEVARLKVLKADHMSQQFKLEDKLLKEFPATIANTRERISALQEDVRILEAHPVPKDGFLGMTVSGRQYSEKADAGAAILEACRQFRSGSVSPIGEYRGLAMQLSYDTFNNTYDLILKGTWKHHVMLGSDARGNITRIDNTLAGIAHRIAGAEQQLETLKMQSVDAEAELGKPFPQEKELQEKTARLAELDALLNMDGPADEEDRGSKDMDAIGNLNVAEKPENAPETYAGDKPSIISSLREQCATEVHRPPETRQYLRAGETR
ncbi:MAG: helicase-related protein, partial [Candidatus Weimeria sp.]